MTTIAATDNTNSALDMTDTDIVGCQSVINATSNFFFWRNNTVFGDVLIAGQNLTYSGSGADRELASGTIERISIEAGADSQTEISGDILITGTEGIVASSIDKDRPESFWSEVLKGNDTFNLAGFSEARVGHTTNVVFGDDLFAAQGTAGEITDQGGNDTINGGDNAFDLIGDVYAMAADRIHRVLYAAGDDVITSAVTDKAVVMIGDAYSVGAFATLLGGGDTLDNSRSTHEQSIVVGDAYQQQGGTVRGGNDAIFTTSSGAGFFGAGGHGDVYGFYGGILVGGHDVIVAKGSGESKLSGDAFAVITGASGTIRGGNDQLTGGAGVDVISGDLLYEFGTSSVVLVGGSDTLNGGDGDDHLFGELIEGASLAPAELAGMTGGNDRIDGGRGNDRLYGQTGNDRLTGSEGNDTLSGGTGNDTLVGGVGRDVMDGGAGNDLFDFDAITDSGAAVSARDLVAGFHSAASDRIDLSTIDANAVALGNQAFTFIGGAAFTGLGQVRVFNNGVDTFIALNTQGNVAADAIIQLQGRIALDVADFLL